MVWWGGGWANQRDRTVAWWGGGLDGWRGGMAPRPVHEGTHGQRRGWSGGNVATWGGSISGAWQASDRWGSVAGLTEEGRHLERWVGGWRAGVGMGVRVGASG